MLAAPETWTCPHCATTYHETPGPPANFIAYRYAIEYHLLTHEQDRQFFGTATQ